MNIKKSTNHIISFLLAKNSVVRSVFLLAGGTTIAQFLSIATMPLLSRIYSPEDFGVLALFSSLTAILVELSGLRYYFAIPLPKKRSFALSLVVLSLILQCIFITILTVLLFLARDFLLELVSATLLEPHWFLIPIGIGGMGLYLILTQWAVREGEFSLIARTRLTQSFWGIVTKLILGFLGFKPLGLLLGAIASQAGGITTLGKRLVQKNGLPKASRTDLKRVAFKYRKFPLFTTWQALLNTLGRQITPIILVTFYGPKTAGLFAFTMHLLQLPAIFIGQAVAQVFVQKASLAKHEGNLSIVSLTALQALLRIGVFPIFCLCLLAPDLFSIVFGNKWQIAGVFSRFLAPWVALAFVSSPLSCLFSILNIQEKGLVIEILFTVSRVTSLFIGSTFGNVWLTLTLFSIVNCFFIIGIIFLILHSVGVPGSKTTYVFIQEIKNTFPLLLPVFLALLFDMPFFISFGVACIMALFFMKSAYLELVELRRT